MNHRQFLMDLAAYIEYILKRARKLASSQLVAMCDNCSRGTTTLQCMCVCVWKPLVIDLRRSWIFYVFACKDRELQLCFLERKKEIINLAMKIVSEEKKKIYIGERELVLRCMVGRSAFMYNRGFDGARSICTFLRDLLTLKAHAHEIFRWHLTQILRYPLKWIVFFFPFRLIHL